jgi:hypothetical protein
MTRIDVALLVFRTLAMWLASSGLIFVVSSLSQAGTEDAAVLGIGVGAGVGMVVIAAGFWAASPWLARTTFGEAETPPAFSLTPLSVPPLACFVVGLLQVVAAIPQAFGWAMLRVARYQSAGLLAPTPDVDGAYHEQAVVTGAEVLARLILGITLIVLSRKAALWTADVAETTDPDPSR